MHIEEEAKKKWCPHVQVSVSTSIDGTEQDDNRNSHKHDFTRQPACLGSDCMAWRWAPPLMQYDCAEEKPTYEPAFGPWEKTENGWASKQEPDLGYCGLAGAPS